MTLNDLLKRVSNKDNDKMFIFRDHQGWSNVNFEIKDNEITVIKDLERPFND